MKIKSYHKNSDYSYTLGVFETIEALHHSPAIVRQVLLHRKALENNRGCKQIMDLCEQHHIPCDEDTNCITRLSKKDNCYAVALLDKQYQPLDPDQNHIMLVHPSNMGNMGTILRTMLGFGYRDLAIIKPGVDVYDPKVIRASMGAIFSVRITYFDSFDSYQKQYPMHHMYSLMLQGASNIHQVQPGHTNHTLIFGNESSGLPEEYATYGDTIFIPHSDQIDSLNLSIAVALTMAHFSQAQFDTMTSLLSNEIDNTEKM